MPLGAEYLCSGPESLAGSSIFKLGLNSFDCYWKYGVMSGILVCLLAAAVVVIAVLCFRQTRNSSSRSICAVGSSSTAEATSGAIEASGSGCSMFLKSAPYTPLDEEELTIRGGIEDQAPADGFCIPGQTIPSGSFQDGAASRQSASKKKSSKCNGFSRAKSRSHQSTTSQDEAVMQTCALVEDHHSATLHPVNDDFYHAGPCFVTTCNSDADHIEDAV